MGRPSRAVTLLLASWPCVQSALLYRGSEESDWYSALAGATISSVTYPASEAGDCVTSADQHEDQGIHWARQLGINNPIDYPCIWSETSAGTGFYSNYQMDFVDPSDGSARGVKAVAITIVDIPNTVTSQAKVQIRDSSNQAITMVTTGGTETTSSEGTGFFGIVAEAGEEIYSVMSGSTASHSSRCSDVKYSVLGTATTPTTTGAPRAVGDPHLTNTLGQRFDVVRAGTHALLQVPRGAAPRKTLLRIDAAIWAVEGERCGPLFIRRLTLRGSWAAAKNVTSFEAGPWPGARPGGRKSVRVPLGPLALLVQFRQDRAGFYYLNVFVPGLGKAGVPIGGLLGQDDHAWASSDPSCSRRPAGHSARGRGALRGRGGAAEVALDLPAWGAEGLEAARGSCMRAALADSDLEC